MGLSSLTRPVRRQGRRRYSPWILVLLLAVLSWAVIAWGGVALNAWLG